MAGEDGLFQMDLNLHPNEASGLLTIGDEAQTAAITSRCTLPQDAHSGSLEAELVRQIPSVEGIAVTGEGRVF